MAFQFEVLADSDPAEVKLAGTIDEEADLGKLRETLEQFGGKARLDLTSVERINSYGVREWVNLVRSVSGGEGLELLNCTPALVAQLNMISNFSGSAKVLSVQAPYICPECNHEMVETVDVSKGRPSDVSSTSCPQCSSDMEFDDLEESYFSFLDS